METVLALLAAVIGIALVFWAGRRSATAVERRRDRQLPEPPIPPGVTLRSQPLLTGAEAGLYNMLRLAVQEQYLVFAQVPLWCLVTVQASERLARADFLTKIALRRVDFVLVHPGSLAVRRVIELESPSGTTSHRQERDRLVEAVCKAADLELVRLKRHSEYTVPKLAALLGIEPEEP
jgi:hypothetical protein